MAKQKIILIANTAWNLWNYRSALIRRLTEKGLNVVLAAPNDRSRVILEEAFPVRFVPLHYLSRSSLSPWSNLRSLLELLALFRREQPDLTVLYTIKPNLLGNWAARITSTPTVSVVEGLGYSGTLPPVWRRLLAPALRIALEKSRKVVFLNNDDAAEFLKKKLVREDQALVLNGPGVNVRHFNVSRQLPPGNRPVRFLFCGRLLIEKGIREFVQVARKMVADGLPAEFYILGQPDPDNPGSISLHEWKALRQEPWLRCLGFVDDVRPTVAAADVLVLPSYYREGVPRSVLEGMGMGKPVITTDMPGCRDTVEPGKNGFLIRPRQTDELLEAMTNMLQLSPEQRQAMGDHSRRLAVEKFSDEQVLPPLLDLICRSVLP